MSLTSTTAFTKSSTSSNSINSIRAGATLSGKTRRSHDRLATQLFSANDQGKADT
jgi:hypothetical protein